MSKPLPQIGRPHRLFGSLALLVVVLALIGNIFAYGWYNPYNLRDLDAIAQARKDIHMYYVDEIDDQALIDAAIRGMADSLGDKNTVYMNREDYAEFKQHMSGKFHGIGAYVEKQDDFVRVINPLDNSPAMRAGVLPGDLILTVDGKDTSEVDLDVAVGWLKGPQGTQVDLRIRHPDGEEVDLTLTRDEIVVPSVVGYRRDPGNGYHYMIDTDQDIGYIKLTQFGEKSADDFQARLATLKQQGVKALIIDLRNNGGGLLEAAVKISDLFLTQNKTIVSVQERGQPKITMQSTSSTLTPKLPVVVLINEYSASASEIVAGALRDNNRALIVGTRSFGKGSVQQAIYLDQDQSTVLKLTTAYWYIPSGKLIHKKEGASTWGVDPSPGCFVVMDDQRIRDMLIQRNQGEAADIYGQRQGPITPQWLRDNLFDDQLAAALEAAQRQLKDGNWPKVGEGLAQAMAEPTAAEQLIQQREEILRALEQINAEIEALDEGKPVEQPELIEQP